MKRFATIVFVFAISCCLRAQVVDTTVCEILKNPQSFNGKIVRVKASAVAAFDQFVVKGGDCGVKVNDLWLSYPEGIKAKAGPAMMVRVQPARNFAGEIAAIQRTPVELDKNNKDFKQFDSLLAANYNKSGGMCLGCNRYEVTATLVGRLDGVESATLRRNDAGKITGFGGFGHMNAYSARLVLQSVSDVSSKEIDYSKTLSVTKNDTVPDSSGTDPLDSVRKAAASTPAGNSAGQQFKRAIDAFGKDGDHNSGVVILDGNANTAAAKDEMKGTADSLDGLLFICTFNSSRTYGESKARALVFAGENVANLRNPLPGAANAELYDLEMRAWVTTVLDAFASHQKTLTLPGGYLIVNSAWPPADMNKNVDDAIDGFLTIEELVRR
jgi:hypothetical protein